MRIKNKYLRNRHFRNKCWKKIRSKEHPFETCMPWFYYNASANYSTEQQIADSFDWIEQRARFLYNGTHIHVFHASSLFRRLKNIRRKSQERQALQKINNGRYDTEFPVFKRDADWDYF